MAVRNAYLLSIIKLTNLQLIFQIDVLHHAHFIATLEFEFHSINVFWDTCVWKIIFHIHCFSKYLQTLSYLIKTSVYVIFSGGLFEK